MIYLLIFTVIILLVYAYIITGKDILSPWVISCSMYIISIFFVLINAKKWSIDIDSKTVLVIVSALISFGIGEVIIRYGYNKKENCIKNESTIFSDDNKVIIIPKYQIAIITSIMIIILFWYFKETYRLSLIGGNPGGYNLMLKYARSVSVTNSINSILVLLLALCNSMANFLVFVTIYNLVYFGRRAPYKRYIVPIVVYLLQLILTTGREPFIQFISTIIILSYILIKRKNNFKVKNSKLIFYGIFSIIVFLILFFVLGFLTNKSFLGFGRTISLYVGGSIVGLNEYLKNPNFTSEYFGSNTLFGIYASLAQIGIKVPKLYAPLEMFFIGSDGVNIYTPLRRYIQDFSYFGMIFIQFSLGMIYTSALMYIKRKRKIDVTIIIFAMLFYPIVESAIEERFFMLVLSFNGAFKVVGVILLYWLLLPKNKPRYKKQ